MIKERLMSYIACSPTNDTEILTNMRGKVGAAMSRTNVALISRVFVDAAKSAR